MGMTTTAANNFLLLLLEGTTWSGLARNDASPLTVLYLSLHSSDPGAGGNQGTNEISYTGYSRLSINRDNTGWSISGNVADPAADQSFPLCTAGTATGAYLGIGTDASGAGHLLWSGPITPSIAISAGVTPIVKAASTLTVT
jgi:hypothetical protein